MALFRRKHIERILEGRKVQTRRIHRHKWKIGKTYTIRDRWFDPGKGQIIITRKFKQRLGDVNAEDAKKEGYDSLAEFKQVWEEIHGQGSWDPNQIVTAYEFKTFSKIGKPSSEAASRLF